MNFKLVIIFFAFIYGTQSFAAKQNDFCLRMLEQSLLKALVIEPAVTLVSLDQGILSPDAITDIYSRLIAGPTKNGSYNLATSDKKDIFSKNRRRIERALGNDNLNLLRNFVRKVEAKVNDALSSHMIKGEIVASHAFLTWTDRSGSFRGKSIGKWHYDGSHFTAVTTLIGATTEFMELDQNDRNWIDKTSEEIDVSSRKRVKNGKIAIWRSSGYSKEQMRKTHEIFPPLYHRSPQDIGPRLVVIMAFYYPEATPEKP